MRELKHKDEVADQEFLKQSLLRNYMTDDSEESVAKISKICHL